MMHQRAMSGLGTFTQAVLMLTTVTLCSTHASAAQSTETSRIEYVVPLPHQPQEDAPATIWYDDFNGDPKPYGDDDGPLDEKVGLGGVGKSLVSVFAKGSQGKGKRSVFFGDSPTGDPVQRKGETFDEVYWRVYVKHQHGWRGAEAKLSRATSLTSGEWTQAMIAHVWSGKGNTLTLDPASGVSGRDVVTTKYNDFEKLHWLGNEPDSKFQFSSSDEAGWWVCVESMAKLNTPGKSDGVNRLWIDGRLECERKNLDFRGNYTAHQINAVFLESYWNDGSPVTQSRWIDNFVVSTKPIGPVVCLTNPVLQKTPYHGPGTLVAWEVEVATDPDASAVVWKSKPISNKESITVNAESGEFLQARADTTALAPAARHFVRVRQKGGNEWSDWSPWHQCFLTGR